ncbi:formiminoglutamase (plasmid) [Haloterrigena turkmenica DSM 5511]|uniref:Formimidoylglutamase n=1 Tax=Haloterrigena turkmenica (strain ATCC 51198 / DSM 5511 / JCM 9101 / NCIMB 13204 / VKM B-1734 / 4k) TaxID=543526 RepID=D2S0P0_HALTV|nr:formimidoylglutamase [Haloterrigena turkmenica]ADB62937.1 formiminoglutamase [Haloterrigena turkmenica DSM 5511]
MTDTEESMNEFTISPDWTDDEWRGMAQSTDPNDELVGHIVEGMTLEAVDDADVDAVLVGEPYDGAVISRSGAREGPTEIRRSLVRTKTHHFDCGPLRVLGDLGDVRSLVDAGTPGTDSSVAVVQSTLRETTARVHECDAVPIFLGGDNSLTYPNVAPLLEQSSVGVINLDAHLDVREVRGEPTSGTPYRQLFAAGLDQYVCLGARHFETATPYHEFVRERGGAVITAEEVADDAVETATHALDAMGDVDRLYVSVDCDVLDASAAPGVSAPTPGGITTRELFRCLRLLTSDERLAGFEVVECAPPLDRNGLTTDAAARAVAHALAGFLGGQQ